MRWHVNCLGGYSREVDIWTPDRHMSASHGTTAFLTTIVFNYFYIQAGQLVAEVSCN